MTWVHDPLKNWAPLEINGQKQRRYGNPPCRLCPKGNPDEAHQHELTPQNIAAVRHFLRHRAMQFNGLDPAEKSDPIVQSNFEIIDQVFREFDKATERAYETQRMAALIQLSTPKGKR